MTIEEVKRKYEKQWMAVPGVVSVGIGLNSRRRKVISIGVATAGSSSDTIPSVIEGYEVVVKPTGIVRAQTNHRTDRENL